ncbi:MAG: hypothetical protein RLZZ598_113 [Pseudomonadota bacterium]
MKAWFEQHFRDEQVARLTLAKVTVGASVIGFTLVLNGCLVFSN